MEQEGVNIAGLAFKTCPLWAPSLDGRLISTLMFLPTKDLTWFEQPGIDAAKFETCPMWGGISQDVENIGRQRSCTG